MIIKTFALTFGQLECEHKKVYLKANKVFD